MQWTASFIAIPDLKLDCATLDADSPEGDTHALIYVYLVHVPPFEIWVT